MSGVFTPSPGSAPLAAQVRAQGAMETRLLLRNGEQLVLAVVIPVLVLVAGVAAAGHVGLDFSRPAVDVLTPGVLALAVMSTSFASLAITTGFERRYGVLKRLGASPLPRTGLLLGKVVALVLVEALQSRHHRRHRAGAGLVAPSSACCPPSPPRCSAPRPSPRSAC